MKQFNYKSGKLGEKIAAEFLGSKGYQVLEKNFQTRFGEIDLIASFQHVLVFVEVKLKVGEQFGSPEEMINKRKLFQVRQTAERYLLENKGLENAFEKKRIDAVCMVLNEDKSVKRIDHYENIEE